MQSDEVIEDDDQSTMYFYNITDQKLEFALSGGVAFISANESGEVTFLKLSNESDLNASIDVVQWKETTDNEQEKTKSEISTLRSYSLESFFLKDILEKDAIQVYQHDNRVTFIVQKGGKNDIGLTFELRSV